MHFSLQQVIMKNQISSIPAQHLNNTQTLMDLFCITMEEAYHYLQSFGFHLQTAINHRIDPQSFPNYNQLNGLPKIKDNRKNQYQAVDLTQNNDIRVVTQIRRRNQTEAERKKYEKTYLIKKELKIKKKRKAGKQRDIINLQSDSKEKIEEQFSFKNSLNKLTETEVGVTFQEQICNTFDILWKQKWKVIALHCINFVDSTQLMPPFKEILQFTKQIYRTPIFVQVFNKEFINYGLDITKFDFNLFQFLKEFISQQDSYSIILLRYNTRSQKVQLLQKLPFSQAFKLTNPLQFISLAKRIKTQNNKKTDKQRYGYKQEMTEAQKNKLIEDRAIMQQQQQLYFKQLNTQIKDVVVQEPVVQVNQPKEEVNIIQIRKQNRSLLPIYAQNIQNAINLKVRLPNSQIIYFCLPKTQTLSYVFKSIENSEQNQLGFEDEINRKFDIILPLQRISLAQRKNQTLNQIFGQSDMETLIVKEI